MDFLLGQTKAGQSCLRGRGEDSVRKPGRAGFGKPVAEQMVRDYFQEPELVSFHGQIIQKAGQIIQEGPVFFGPSPGAQDHGFLAAVGRGPQPFPLTLNILGCSHSGSGLGPSPLYYARG